MRLCLKKKHNQFQFQKPAPAPCNMCHMRLCLKKKEIINNTDTGKSNFSGVGMGAQKP